MSLYSINRSPYLWVIDSIQDERDRNKFLGIWEDISSLLVPSGDSAAADNARRQGSHALHIP